MTEINGKQITYDEIGNPLYIGVDPDTLIIGQSLTWEGRQLMQYQEVDFWFGELDGILSTTTYTYNDEGIRTSKNVNGVLHEYYLDGSQIVAEKVGNKLYVYVYDENGRPVAIKYRTDSYAKDVFDYYVLETNFQGDVVAIYKLDGTKIGSYAYNAYGVVTTTVHNSSYSSIVNFNPFRYRSYYYDTDTGWYYLQSRYYNPAWGRFINGDAVVAGVGRDVKGYNLFAYCFNNPVNMDDRGGTWPEWLTDAVNWVANALGITTSVGSVATTRSSVTAKGPTISRNTSLGIVSSKASGSLGYVTGSFRGQATHSNGSTNSMIGGFCKVSALNFDSQNRIGTQNLGISKKDVLDVGTVTAQAGIQYKDGWGVSLGAKASVVAARGTYCVDVFGWKVEVGMSAQFLSYGYEFAYGALPKGGWGVKKGASTGLFGYSYLIRITPA